jgi:hypothetical protein
MLKDQRDLLLAFNAHEVRYLVVGGYAFNHYTEPRATKDLDVFVDTSDVNARRVLVALAAYGAPVAGYTPADFQNAQFGFQFGMPPSRIDVLLAIEAVGFEEAWTKSQEGVTGDGISVRYLSVEDLIRNKQAVGRLRDLADVEALREAAAANGENLDI